MYTITKSYGHEEGLSVAFRQWRTPTNCSRLHGYSLAVSVTLGCVTLSPEGWVLGYSSFKPLRAWLHSKFDHTTIIAISDPEYATFRTLHERSVLQLVTWRDNVCCESFAEAIYEWMAEELQINHNDDYAQRALRVLEVSVAEHGGNRAVYSAANLFVGVS